MSKVISIIVLVLLGCQQPRTSELKLSELELWDNCSYFKYAGPVVAGFEITPMVDDGILGIVVGSNFIPIEDTCHYNQFKKDFPRFIIPDEVAGKYTPTP